MRPGSSDGNWQCSSLTTFTPMYKHQDHRTSVFQIFSLAMVLKKEICTATQTIDGQRKYARMCTLPGTRWRSRKPSHDNIQLHQMPLLFKKSIISNPMSLKSVSSAKWPASKR